MVDEAVREQAKAEIRLRLWAAERGKRTRAYVREHEELIEEYARTGKLVLKASVLPPYVTEASVQGEIRRRLRDRELRQEARRWREEHPEEVERIKEEIFGQSD